MIIYSQNNTLLITTNNTTLTCQMNAMAIIWFRAIASSAAVYLDSVTPLAPGRSYAPLPPNPARPFIISCKLARCGHSQTVRHQRTRSAYRVASARSPTGRSCAVHHCGDTYVHQQVNRTPSRTVTRTYTRTHAHTHARTRAQTYTRTNAHTHTRTHRKSHL